MNQVKNNTTRRKGQHLDYTTRKIIEGMLNKGFSRKEIAEAMEVS